MKALTQVTIIPLSHDPELITMKALDCIRHADVIVVGSTAPEVIKESMAKSSRLMKWNGQDAAMTGESILKSLLQVEKVVVVATERELLNSFGDFFRLLEAHQITVSCIPSLRPELSLVAQAGIPLTRRGWNESFCVIDGETSDMRDDLRVAAKSTATIIIKNSYNQLKCIQRTICETRSEEEPIALVWQIRAGYPASVITRAADIHRELKKHCSGGEAIIVVGKVVNAATLHRYDEFLEKSESALSS